MSEDYIPFPDLVDKISSFCSKKETGLLFIATKANRSAQIVLENGKIVFVYFYNKQGQEALDLMLTIKAGRYKFQKMQHHLGAVPSLQRRRFWSISAEDVLQPVQQRKLQVA